MKAKTGNIMNPHGVLVDFEEALVIAFKAVFDLCSIWHDFFHFQQANVHKLQSMGLSDLRADVSAETRVIWKCSTKTEFDAKTDAFLGKWDEIIPQYTRYFRDTWLKRFPPEEWASFARPKDAPTGKIKY